MSPIKFKFELLKLIKKKSTWECDGCKNKSVWRIDDLFLRSLRFVKYIYIKINVFDVFVRTKRKHPIILPYKHHVTDLIIKQCHESLGHMGQECVLSSLQETIWIVKGRDQQCGV